MRLSLSNEMVVFIMLSLALLAHGNDTIRFDSVQLIEGSDNISITGIVQDDYGFMWFATRQGLYRYDGHDCRPFRYIPQNENSISNNSILNILKDGTGTLWIVTEIGSVDSIDSATGEITHYRIQPIPGLGESRDLIDSLFIDSVNDVWAVTISGQLLRLNDARDRFEYFVNGEDALDLSDVRINMIFEDHDEVLISVEDVGFFEFDRQARLFKRHSDDQAMTRKYLGLGDFWNSGNWRSRMWAKVILDAVNTGNIEEDVCAQAVSHFQDQVEVTHNVVTSFLQDSDGNVWIGTNGLGLVHVARENSDVTIIRSDRSGSSALTSNNIQSIYQSKSDTIWVGTSEGLNKYSKYKYKFSSTTNLLADGTDDENPESRILSIYEDAAGNIWAGTLHHGLVKKDQQSGHFRRYAYNNGGHPVNLTVNALFQDSGGDLYIGTMYNGLLKYDPAGDTIQPLTEPFSVAHIIEDSQGTLRFAAFLRGIGEYHPDSDSVGFWEPVSGTENSIESFDARVLIEDRHGNLWIGSEGQGLIKLDRDNGTYLLYQAQPDIPGNLIDDRVISLAEGKDGAIWIGTRGGLTKLNPETNVMQSFFESNGLPDNVVCGILEDSAGSLWLSTYSGISRFDPLTNESVTYDISDGLQDYQFTPGAYSKSNGGTMYFGGVRGYNSFNPAHLSINSHIPDVLITRVSNLINPEKDYALQASPQRIEFTHSENSFVIDFSVLDYTDPTRNGFRYQLSGLDQEWNVGNGTRQARYSGVPPGDYVFRVFGSNSDGIWNQEGARIEIRVIPPFWVTWQFRLLAAIGAFISVFAVYKYRTAAIKRRQGVLMREIEERKIAELRLLTNQERLRSMSSQLTLAEERQRRAIAQSLHDDVGHSLVAAQVKMSIVNKKSDDSEVKGLIEDVSELIETALDKSRSLTSELSPPALYKFGFESAVENLVEKFGEDHGIKAVVTLVNRSSIDEELSVLLYQSIRELLINILKHAEAEAVNVIIDADDENIKVTIRDDGKGFDAEAFLGSDGQEGYGLFSIRERLESLGGSLSIASKPGKGTKITMSAPSQENE